MCKIFEYWAAKWYNLKRHDWEIAFLSETIFDGTHLHFTFTNKSLINSWCSTSNRVIETSDHSFKCLFGYAISTNKSECAAKFRFASVLSLLFSVVKYIMKGKPFSHYVHSKSEKLHNLKKNSKSFSPKCSSGHVECCSTNIRQKFFAQSPKIN